MSNDLAAVVRDIESDWAARGWDQAPTLYALVATADLLEREPHLELALAGREGVLTAIEQEPLPDSLEKFLPTIEWPAEVLGAAIAIERWLDPGQGDVRMVAAVMRDGSKACALRVRSHEDDVIFGPDLIPGLTDLLAQTFSD